MKPSRTIVLSVATALGIGFAGASVAGNYERAHSRAAQPLGMSIAAMETHFGAHPGEVSYFNDFPAAPATTLSQAEPAPALGTQPRATEDLQPAATTSLESGPIVTVVEPVLLYRDGPAYRDNVSDGYAREGGESQAVDSESQAVDTRSSVPAEGTRMESVTWYHVTEIPVQIVLHSADGTEQYVVQDEDLLVFTPIAVEGDSFVPIVSAEIAEGRYVYF